MLNINTVLQAAPDRKTLITGFARLLAIKEGFAILIRLDVSSLRSIAAPFMVAFSELDEAVKKGDILSEQIFDIGLPASKDELSPAASKRLAKIIDLIKPLLEDEQLLFDPKLRVSEFKRRAKETGVSFRTILRSYYRYFWGGQTENAFIPSFYKCGGPQKRQKKGTARRGRKTMKNKAPSQVQLPEVLEKLVNGATSFYLSGQHTLDTSYVLTMKKYFKKGEKFNGTDKLQEILKDPSERPTFWQFRYVCRLLETQRGKRTKHPRRIRAAEPKWNFRGNARQDVRGPGDRFEIDATKLQVQLVSRLGRENLVGTPTLYVVIDVWSGAYVGYALSLENASWALAAKALCTSFQEKTHIFSRLGLPYGQADWPCQHLPTRLSADRGELVGEKSGMLSELGIKVEIMPPMCPQRKGKVEAAINAIKHCGFYHIPGSYAKFPKRREPDGKDTAALNIEELEMIIVEVILDLNNDPIPQGHVPPEMLQDDNPDVTHIGVYRWGLDHRQGFTRTLSPKDVYTNLLTKAEASVTARGIYFQNQNYFCEELRTGGYLEAATAKGRYKKEIRYDEHLADKIWFLDTFSNEWIPADNDNEEIRRLKYAFFELESVRKHEQQLRDEARSDNVHRKDEKNKQIAHEVKEAEAEAKAKRGHSKSQSKSRIRLNKQFDKGVDRLIPYAQTPASYLNAIDAARVPQEYEKDAEGADLHTEEKKIEKTFADISIDLWEK